MLKLKADAKHTLKKSYESLDQPHRVIDIIILVDVNHANYIFCRYCESLRWKNIISLFLVWVLI